MSVAKFKVIGTFDVGGGMQVATVMIDRATGIISVRPLRRKRTYELPLSTVAALICRLVISSELREKRALRAVKRKRSKS